MSDDPAQQNAPKPEVLEARHDDTTEHHDEAASTKEPEKNTSDIPKPAPRRNAYRPSHKGTFVGLMVIVIILVINVGVIMFIMRQQTDADAAAQKESVMLSGEVLNTLGVSRNPVGNAETLLTIGPNTVFNGKVTAGADVTIGGQLTLNSKFTAGDASLTNLQAGNTQVQELNINGDGTVTNLNIRRDLQVAGATRVQGQLTVNQLTTINNNLNVAGNLSIGGSLSVRNFQVGQLTVGGHLLSTGAAPGVSSGGGVGSSGTVSISGNDTAGTVAVNTGTGAGNGVLAQISFRTNYTNTPHVLVTPVGRPVPNLYVNRNATGFSISVSGALPPGGYAFDYMVVQ